MLSPYGRFSFSLPVFPLLVFKKKPKQSVVPLFSWGGKFHLVPEDFKFPVVNTQQIFVEFCCGNHENGYSALQGLTALDFPGPERRKQRKQLCEFHWLMKLFKDALQDTDSWIKLPSVIEANTMYKKVELDVLKLLVNPKRRLTQIQWNSVANLLRKAKAVKEKGTRTDDEKEGMELKRKKKAAEESDIDTDEEDPEEELVLHRKKKIPKFSGGKEAKASESESEIENDGFMSDGY